MDKVKEGLRPELPAGAILGLDGLRPVGIERSPNRTVIEVDYYSCQVAQEQGKPCPGCQVHDRRPGRCYWTDVPHGTPVWLRPAPVRLRRKNCGGKAGVPPTISKTFQMTKSAANWALLASMKEPFAEVGREMDYPPERVAKLFAAIQPFLDGWKPQSLPNRIAIDGVHTHDGTYTVLAGLNEHAGRKGHLLDLLPTHQSEKIEEILMDWPDRYKVEVVAIDPSLKLRSVVQKIFTKAKIVVDKRHVMSGCLKCCDTVRKHYAGDIDRIRSRKAAEAPAKKSLKRASEKRAGKLTAADRALIEAVPIVAAAYQAKERFYAIYETCHSPSKAKAAVKAWWNELDVALLDAFRPIYVPVTETWGEEFANHFAVKPRVTTAFVESINRTLRGFEADARGNAGHARLRAQLLYRFGGLTADQLKGWLAASL